MSKAARNRANRNGSPKLPPTAGAVDLGALKKRPENAEAVATAEVQMLERQGLICPCGERVRDQGVEYLAVVNDTVQAPGGAVATLGLGSTTFHSIDCAVLQQLLAHGHGADGPRPLALRAVNDVIWLDELTKPKEPSS